MRAVSFRRVNLVPHKKLAKQFKLDPATPGFPTGKGRSAKNQNPRGETIWHRIRGGVDPTKNPTGMSMVLSKWIVKLVTNFHGHFCSYLLYLRDEIPATPAVLLRIIFISP